MSDSIEPFAGQLALVTGASGGIGAAIAETLVRGGARVVLVGRRRAALQRLARRCGIDATEIVVADLTSDRELSSLARGVVGPAGNLDILVHSAGLHVAAPLATARVRDFDRLWATNVRAPFLLTQRLLPALQRARGQIVFVNSSVGISARAGAGQYSATHHGLRALADALRDEINEDGVRVVTVYPGRTATGMQERIYGLEGRPYQPDKLLQPSDIADVVISALALPRSAEVTDLRIRSLRKP